MMSMNNKRNRGGGRMNPGPGRTEKRQIYSQDRQTKTRGQTNDKNVPIEGLYKNSRLTHVMYSMVGCVVQVQVKNGIVYEGILNTTSSSGDTVLECAHMVEDNGGNGSPVSSTPSKDRILSKLIIKNSDLVTLNAPSIDLDYAVKDSFTDTGISKFNGETKEKEMRELTPWESDGGYEISLDEGDKSSNGWDANEMFQTNALQFNVQSSYDDSLGQYTTKLERGNSEEYRRRELEAQKLAAEIERCDSYKKNIAMENGEGGDEEAAFSAVVRPGDSSSHPQPTGSGGPGKYQPPFKRQQGSSGVSKGRGGYSSQTNRNMPGSQHQSAHVTQVSSQSSVESVNGDETNRQTIPASTAGPTVKTSPTIHEHGPPSQSEKSDHAPHVPHYVDGKKPTKGRDEQIKELKAFGKNFKLDDNKDNTKDKDKDKESRDNSEKSSVERKDSVSEEKDSGSEKVVNVSENKENTQPTVTAVPVTVSQQEKPASDDRQVDGKSVQSSSSSASSHDSVSNPSKSKLNPEAKEFTLNPDAKEFVPGNLSFQMSVQQQAPSPHRPQTQSPVVLAQQMPQPMFPNTSQQQYAVLPQGHPMVLNPPAAVAAAAASQAPYKVQPKRAVVSVKPDYPPSAVQAATGQPLLAQSANPGYMFLQHQVMPPQPTGYQMGQVMPMPAAQASGQRYMTPTSVQGVPSSMPHASGMERGNPALQASQVYMTTPNQGPMPAHLSHASHFTHNNHIIMSNPNSQQQQQSSQMNAPPSGAGGPHHPAPSPVHTNPNPQSMNPGPHPPSSGTPQPHQGYTQPNMPTHPPLQQSPHNPTSPQNMQTMYPYQSHPMQMQGTAGTQQFSSVPQHSSVPTSGTFSMQTHPSPHLQPQYVMMPPSGQINHPHLQSSHQFQGHPMPGKFSGSMQPQLMSQSGVQGLPGQNPGQGPHPPHQMQHIPLQGLAAITSALHARPEHFIVQHVRK